MADKIKAFHGTSSKTIKKAQADNRLRGWFDTDRNMCMEYAWGKSRRDGSRPVIVEVHLTEKRFGLSWVAQAQRALGYKAATSELSLSWKMYVKAIWRFSPSKRRWLRKAV